MVNSFFDDAYRKFSAMGMPELIDEYNRRVMLGYRGGWGVWGWVAGSGCVGDWVGAGAELGGMFFPGAGLRGGV